MKERRGVRSADSAGPSRSRKSKTKAVFSIRPSIWSRADPLQKQRARIERVRVLTVIHGYGSSGKGGVIRSECRKNLDYLCSTGGIKEYIPGEDFSARSGPVKTLLRRFPELANNKNLDRHNPGVTLVIIQ